MTTHAYLSRSDWGGEWDGSPRAERLPDAECYIHHVGGAGWMDGEAAAVFRQLNEHAINNDGYQFLDYDILVHYDRTRDILTIGEGRGEFMSAATRHRNEEGEAIVLCGNTHVRQPLDIELEGLARAHVIGVEHGWIARDALILGHRDNRHYPGGQATACPGDYLYAELSTIRRRVAELLAPEPTPAPPPEEDDMARLYLARLDSNKYYYRRGDGLTGNWLRSNELEHLANLYDANMAHPRFYNPRTGAEITEWGDVPVMRETDLDLWVGYVDDTVVRADEG